MFCYAISVKRVTAITIFFIVFLLQLNTVGKYHAVVYQTYIDSVILPKGRLDFKVLCGEAMYYFYKQVFDSRQELVH